MKWLALALLAGYQRLVSPLFPPRCRYYPSCSQYAVECFHKYSFFKALGKSLWRVMRCNPWSHGGVDHP
jgi:putative membrane protein insertion efficiency factor